MMRRIAVGVAGLLFLLCASSSFAGPVVIAALTTEINTDPTSLGLVALKASGSHAGIADALNLRRATISVFRDNIESWEIAAALVKTDWDALSAGDKQLFAALLAAGRIDATSASMRTIMTSMFPGGSVTLTNLAGVASRQGSRSEQLWGTGASVSPADVSAALR